MIDRDAVPAGGGGTELMLQPKRSGRRKATAAAVVLLIAGGLLGVLVDRVWLLPPRRIDAMPLTAQGMAARLHLTPSDEARIGALLDSMHAQVLAAAQRGPDSLVVTARSVYLRLEAALPPEARPEFRAWMQDHHHQMLERLGGAGMHGPAHREF